MADHVFSPSIMLAERMELGLIPVHQCSGMVLQFDS